MKHFPGAIAALLLLVMGILAGGAAFRESITVDEVAHIGAGVSYLQKLDMRMNLEHPPLAKVFAAIPLVFSEVRADYSHPSWSISNHGVGGMLGEWSRGHFLALRWNNPGSTVLWARVPMLLLTLVLGVLVYRFASELGGPWGGLLCVVAYVARSKPPRCDRFWPPARSSIPHEVLVRSSTFLLPRISPDPARCAAPWNAQGPGRTSFLAASAWPLHVARHVSGSAEYICCLFYSVVERAHRLVGRARHWNSGVNSEAAC
jgi:hypothetical protein